MTVLLTGATGFVGRELLWRLARRPDQRVVCLLRASGAESPNDRLGKLLDEARPEPLTASERSRVSAVAGDLTREGLGLQTAERQSLAAEAGRIVHAAASVDWAAPLDVARAINVEGMRRVIELARSCRSLARLDVLSTCHVCGRRNGPILENDLDDSAGFFNAYERSKFEAERLVRGSGLPFCVFRLSMVVGDSRTGYASTFKVMYWPLKLLSRGAIRIVPADRDGILDIVPVDYVCDALEAISADPTSIGRTYHIAAGPQYASSVGEVLDLAAAIFGVRKPLLVSHGVYRTAIRPLLYLFTWGRRRKMLRKGRVYLPYLSFRASFDTSSTRAALAASGREPAPVRDYFQKLIKYAISSDWGKRA